MAKKKSEPAERIRHLMESLQGGGGGGNARKNQREPAAGQPGDTPNVAKITDASGVAGGLVAGAKADGAAASSAPQHSETAERRKRGMNRPQLSNDGMHAIDDEGDDEQQVRPRLRIFIWTQGFLASQRKEFKIW